MPRLQGPCHDRPEIYQRIWNLGNGRWACVIFDMPNDMPNGTSRVPDALTAPCTTLTPPNQDPLSLSGVRCNAVPK